MPSSQSALEILSTGESPTLMITISTTDLVPVETHTPIGPPPTREPQPTYTSVQAIPTVQPTGFAVPVQTYQAVPQKAVPVKAPCPIAS